MAALSLRRLQTRLPAGSRLIGSFATSDLNPRLVNAEYAVRGEIAIRADELQKELDSGESTLPFDRLTLCNIGNPLAFKQFPMTFTRQVLSVLETPHLLNERVFPDDVKEKARKYLSLSPNGTGPYGNSRGQADIRQEVAEYIQRRDNDGTIVDTNCIYLTNGASDGVLNTLTAVISNESSGIMMPIPVYPLYSALVPLLGGSPVKYYLEEDDDWSLSIEELEKSYKEAVDQGVKPVGIVVINPGNPTSQVLSADNIRQIIEFSHSKGMAVMADEVYQDNIYFPKERPFVSFRKVLMSMPEPYNKTPLLSYHSISKGMTGECGKRGGYYEVVNGSTDLHEQLYKRHSLTLCANLTGQYALGCQVNPPQKGDESYDLYMDERTRNFESLSRKSTALVSTLNRMEGISSRRAWGSMYAFPSIRFSKAFEELAAKQNRSPDMLYCIELLENTGICTVPGSGFGQRDGTQHFRTTFLPPEDQLDECLGRWQAFHMKFLDKYGRPAAA